MGIFEERLYYAPAAGTIQYLEWLIDTRKKEVADIDKKLKNYELNGQKNPPPEGRAEMLQDRRILLVQRNTEDRTTVESLKKPLIP